jgi:hypothetical protein
MLPHVSEPALARGCSTHRAHAHMPCHCWQQCKDAVKECYHTPSSNILAYLWKAAYFDIQAGQPCAVSMLGRTGLVVLLLSTRALLLLLLLRVAKPAPASARPYP